MAITKCKDLLSYSVAGLGQMILVAFWEVTTDENNCSYGGNVSQRFLALLANEPMVHCVVQQTRCGDIGMKLRLMFILH